MNLGKHLLIEVATEDTAWLNDQIYLKQLLKETAKFIGSEIKGTLFHRFMPQGVSGVVLIAESHLSVHTWPEYGRAVFDVFTYGDLNPWLAVAYLVNRVSVSKLKAVEEVRGI